ncbi:MAG: hypothetical protein LH472_05885 [Pyrinomonadaceae bacterium]|nr:hypothetical protein [Pyrinomonadaceae bacterium]
MSLKQKFISTVTLAITVGAFGTFVSAQQTPTEDGAMQRQERVERRGGRGKFGKEGRGGKHGGDRMMMRSLGKLNLTDAQKEQTRAVFENHKIQNQPQFEELRGLAMKKRDGIISADEQTRFKELRTQMKASNDQLQTSILAILTTEQRTQLDQMKEEMKQKRMERRQSRQNQTVAPTSDN